MHVCPPDWFALMLREAAAGHTGQFSWRAGPSGTVLAQHGSAPSTTGGPARGPWVNTGMVRARLAGLSFGAPAESQPQVCSPPLVQLLTLLWVYHAQMLFAQACLLDHDLSMGFIAKHACWTIMNDC